MNPAPNAPPPKPLVVRAAPKSRPATKATVIRAPGSTATVPEYGRLAAVLTDLITAEIERSRSGRDPAELFEAAKRLLPEYAAKLDRLVVTALDIWDRREKQANKYTKEVRAAIERDCDPLLRVALAGLSREMNALDGPLKEWIHKLSALHEEGRLTDLQRLELRIRLTELEAKYYTALTVFAELKKP